MRNSYITILCIFSVLIIATSCKTFYQPQSVKYVDYRLTDSRPKDAAFINMLQPYADSVNKTMGAVVVVTEAALEKEQPEGTLGNVMADAMLAKARQFYKVPVDAAFVNYGGIRLPTVPKGNITRGKLFELAPFDNVIVLLKVEGKTVKQFLNHISARGGWPTAGASWQIKNKQADNITINNAPLNEAAVYTIAVVDYVANGGDDCEMLKTIPQVNGAYLFRDALIEYLTDVNKQGQKLHLKIENRVTHAK
jgi:2',3'-cyclic-nucleotide 2'-phosphodiesterase (5'-nucleotidase family)